MKLVHFILLAAIFPLTAHAGVSLDQKKISEWRNLIGNSCYATYTNVNKNENDYDAEKGRAACVCVARNFTRLVQETSKSESYAEAALTWVNKYYGLKHSKAELEADEFGFEDYRQLISEECLANAKFNYPAR